MSHLEDARLDPFSTAAERVNPLKRVTYDRDGHEVVTLARPRVPPTPPCDVEAIVEAVMAEHAAAVAADPLYGTRRGYTLAMWEAEREARR